LRSTTKSRSADPQVSQHHVQRHVRPDRQHIRVHQAPGGIFGIGKYPVQALPVLPVQTAQHFARDRVRQVVENIGQIVQVEIVDSGDQVGGLRTPDQGGANLVVHFDQHITVVLGIGHLPNRETPGERQGFQQVADFGGGQVLQQRPDLIPGA
jgi:hypothetical protein